MSQSSVSMDKSFADLMKQYAVPFSEICILEEKNDIFYISDIETYDLYYLNSASDRLLNPVRTNYAGKKCYEILQGRDTPCPFCTNSCLTADQYYIWKHHNPVAGKDYLVKDRLTFWNDRMVRMEVALDVTDSKRSNRILLDGVKQQNVLMNWIQILADTGDIETAFQNILSGLCSYFNSTYGFIRAFTENELLVRHPQHLGVQTPFAHRPADEIVREWEGFFAGHVQIIVRSAEELRESNPAGYEVMKAFGLNSLCVTPIAANGRLTGLIGIGNFEKHYDTLFLLKMIASCIASAVQRRVIQDEKNQLQFIDPLTGYMNFEAYKGEVERLLQNNKERKYSLWYCDLKKFKYINDVYGYDAGDRLLKYWADFAAENTRESEAFCRISADNFSVLRTYDNIEELREYFRMILRKFSEFSALSKKQFNLELSSGIYLIENKNDILNISQMLNRANMAQKSVKNLPGSHIAFYTDEMRRKEVNEMMLSADLHEALKREEFILYFQPQLEIQKNSAGTVNAEVLARWHYGHQKLLMPGEFINLFERNGMIIELDYYMFEHTCRYLAQMRKQFDRTFCFSVNVSRITMLQPNFAEDYRKIKEKYVLPDGCLELEFTENGIVEDINYFAELVRKLQSYGFFCSMDDFGSGQSSLNLLQSLPLDILKLDKKFFDGTQNGERNQIVVSCILNMAKMLNMRTVAEGIEIQEQVDILKCMGCDYIQGYVFYKPLPAPEFILKLQDGAL